MLGWKPAAFVLTIAGFIIQSFFVYSNYQDQSDKIELVGAAKHGLVLWRQNNCQACHQLHGFGGFLGPDLTNVIERTSKEVISHTLQYGRKQMPAFHFKSADIEAFYELFTQINATGTGYPVAKSASSSDQWNIIETSMTHLPGNKLNWQKGMQEFKNANCGSCHRPFSKSTGPDLSLVFGSHGDKTQEFVTKRLAEGFRGMPPFNHLDAEQKKSMSQFLWILGAKRQEISTLYKKFSPKVSIELSQLPWFEYE